MKTRSVFFTLLLAAAAFSFMNCAGDKHKEGDAHAEHGDHSDHNHSDHNHSTDMASMNATKPQFEVDSKFREQLSAVFTAYVGLQEALVASDATEAQQAAAETSGALVSVDRALVSGAAQNDWLAYVERMGSSLKDIQAGSDIEAQRTAFSTLSDNLYQSVKAFGLSGEEVYYTYCPMAFNDQGGYWLSDKESVSNPYFGDKMLRCGVVREKLK